MIDLNSVDEYNKLYDRWEKNLSSLIVEQNDQNKKVFLVAMSRKMHRLIEERKKEKRDSIFHNLQFTSEHVLPYALLDFNTKEQCMVILDDAIYYGSTINQLTGYVEEIINTKPHVCPVAVSEVVGLLPHAEMCRPKKNVIKGKNIPFFTTQNAKKIISLCRPIDVEFPILRFNLTSENNVNKNISEALQKHFDGVEVYTIEHRIGTCNNGDIIRNYTILPCEGTTYHRWNNDFCKMRVYVSKHEVQVVAYAPGFLSEEMLSGNQSLFSDNRVQKLWTEVQNRKMAEWPDNDDEDSFKKSIRESYEMQCTRSKVVWANYLASFLYLLEQKDAVCNAISEVYGTDVSHLAKFVEEDTQQLLPPELVSPVTDSLNSYFKEGRTEGATFYGIYSEALANQELIPEEYKNEYLERNRNGLPRCSATNEALSLIFSNQHFFITDGKLGYDYLQQTQRLRFGITYTALEKKLAFPIGIKGLWGAIHRWIDKNIDETTVKPKYECVVMDGNAYWLRMFRAGENEDSFTKMRRLCEFIIGKLRQIEFRNYMEQSVVEDLLALVWTDPCHIINYSYKGDSFVVQEDNRPSFSLTYQTEKGNRNFLDFLVNQGYLRSIQDSADDSRLSTIDENKVNTPLASDQEQAISDYVDAYYFYRKMHSQPYIMNNFIPQTDFEKDRWLLVTWRERFCEYMDNIILSENIQNIRMDEYDDYDKDLNRIIRRTIRADASAVEDSENENRRIIRTWLQKEDTKERKLFRHNLLVALVVKEIFYQAFLAVESERNEESIETLESYLGYIQDKSEDSVVILNFVKMIDDDRKIKEKRENVVRALKNILQK